MKYLKVYENLSNRKITDDFIDLIDYLISPLYLSLFIANVISDGEITWEQKITSWDQNLSTPEFNDFIVAIKRIASDIGRFQFSYDNIYGHRRILIEGKI
jgi:hypothetical protein